MKKDSTALRRYLDGFPPTGAAALTALIADGCKVPRYTVYNWKYGRCRIPELVKDKIEEIAERKIFDRGVVDENGADGL